MTAVSVHVVTVGCDGDAFADLLADGGFTVSGPTGAELGGLDAAIRSAPGADAVCVLGDLTPRSALPGALDAVLDASLPGYGEALRRVLATTAEGPALLLRAEAGLVGGRVVFAVPSAPEEGVRAVALVASALRALEPLSASGPGPAPEPIPFAGRTSSAGLALSENREPEAGIVPVRRQAEPATEEVPASGWQRTVEALGAEIIVGRREDLPESIEKLAPVLNVLHTAGQTGMMKLPSGRRYSLWGWPDLERPGSKVLAVSWGEPLAEIVALHRHPQQAGTCIEEDNGLLPAAGSDIAETCERVCGRAPPDTEGTLFALSADAVWILRSRRVFKWDGSREKDDGNPKQVLASLTLHWSNK
ncbi:MAG: hypothetical protein R3F61_35250 [Myxococcota bacterium]